MIELDRRLPDGISDETAVVINHLLLDLTTMWEERYYAQIRRYHEERQPDPERPWIR
jgi:hypothetical protein